MKKRLERFVPLTVAGFLAILAISASGAFGGSASRLTATVKPCSLTGIRNHSLHRGGYIVVVKDSSSSLYFKLKGPGVLRRTTPSFRGVATWNVVLARGTYHYQCGAKASLQATFLVR